jgi:sterol desaturase/sphingolipid hydroxylase (fatty acid hydroxylase superfamily)
MSTSQQAPSKINTPLWKRAPSILFGLVVFGAYVWILLQLQNIALPLFPEELTVQLFGRSLTLHDVHQKIIDSATTLFVVLPLMIFAEMLFVGWEHSALKRMLFSPSASIRMDLAIVIADESRILRIMGKLMTFGLTAAFGIWVHDRLSAALGVNIGLDFLPYGLQFALYFVLYTFFDYWTHRFNHLPQFWPLHRYHHSTQDFCVITANRQHPAALSGIFLINMPLAMLGAPAEVLVKIYLTVSIIGYLIHSGIDSDWGWFGRWVIQSPLHHRQHHVLEKAQWGTNFGIMPIWDHLFGTYAKPATADTQIGVDTPYNQGFGFLKDVVRDYVDFWVGIARAGRQWLVPSK